jgi:hypothetical protein
LLKNSDEPLSLRRDSERKENIQPQINADERRLKTIGLISVYRRSSAANMNFSWLRLGTERLSCKISDQPSAQEEPVLAEG